LRDAVKNQVHLINNVNPSTFEFDLIEPINEKRFQLIFSAQSSSTNALISKNTHFYPNPAQGTIFIREHLDLIRIVNSIGQEISFEVIETSRGFKTVKFEPNTPAGIYFLQHSNGTEKLQLIEE
jgi:hypothetical protein